jgi:membrane fusion protein, multidrug efflux system
MKIGKPTLIAGVALGLAATIGVALVVSQMGRNTGPQVAAAGGPSSGGARPDGAPAQAANAQAGRQGGPPGAGGPGGGRRMPPSQVVALPVAERPFLSRVEALGTLEPRERVELTANASDRVVAVYFEDGQRVRKGATLMTLASEEERAQLESSQAQLAEARRQLERNKRLASNDAVSELELQRSTRDADSAAAQVRALEARLRDRVLTAPFDGVLGFRNVSVGAFVSPGQPVATLIDDREMRLEFAVPSINGASLSRGLRIEGRTADVPGEVFEGTLTSIDNAIDPVTRTIKVRATLPNEKRLLKTGMFLTVQLFASERRALAVPEIAVVAEGSDTFVFLVDQTATPNLAVKTPVTLGVREKGVVEVVAGLSPGDLVVTDGILKVRPNGPVIVQGAPPAGATPPDARLAGGPPGEASGLVR